MVRVNPSLSGTCGFPAEQVLRARDIRPALPRVILGQRPMNDRDCEPVRSRTALGSSRMANSSGLPMFRAGDVGGRIHQPDEPIDQIVDVAERSRLRPVAIDGDVATEQA